LYDVVVDSAFDDELDRADLRELGASGRLARPYVSDHILYLLSTLNRQPTEVGRNAVYILSAAVGLGDPPKYLPHITTPARRKGKIAWRPGRRREE